MTFLRSSGGHLAAASLCLAAASPFAHASLQVNSQAATLSTTVYAGPGAVGLSSADGSSYQSDTQRLAAGTLGSAELSATANVDNQLTLGAGALYQSVITGQQISVSSGLAFGSNINTNSFSADMAAGATLKAQARLVFTATEDTLVELNRSRVVMADPAEPASSNFLSSYSLARVVAQGGGINTVTGLPDLMTTPVANLVWDTSMLLSAGTYVLSVDNVYAPAAWIYQYTAIVLGGGSTVVTNPQPGFVSSLLASTSISVRDLSATSASVPEPGTWALMALGLVGVAVAARRRVHG